MPNASRFFFGESRAFVEGRISEQCNPEREAYHKVLLDLSPGGT